MALQLNYIKEDTGTSLPESYLKIDQINIFKPNGVISIYAESALYSSKHAKDSGKRRELSIAPILLGARSLDDEDLENGSTELPENIKQALDSIFTYAYEQIAKIKFNESINV